MKKTLLFTVLAASLALSGCVQTPRPDVGMNADEPILATLQATVVDKLSDDPIPNVIVYLGYNSSAGTRCQTDENGKCTIAGKNFARGDYGLNAYKKGYVRFGEQAHFKKGNNERTIKLEKKSEIPDTISITGTIIEIITAPGTKSENHFYKIKNENGGKEEFIFNEIGGNNGFGEFVEKKVTITGYREKGFAGWQGGEFEGIYVEKIEAVK